MENKLKYASREDQTNKILAILQDFIGDELNNLICTDIGCNTGEISIQLAPHLKAIFGIDNETKYIHTALNFNKNNNAFFSVADACHIPFPDETFDLVICAQVYEHLSEPSLLVKEIWRILRPTGVCFFSGPNRYSLIEEHYWLPFLSWLPRSISNRYLNVFRHISEYNINPKSYWQLLSIWEQFDINDYSIKLIKKPTKYSTVFQLKRLSWISKLPEWILELFVPLIPNYNWILTKPEN